MDTEVSQKWLGSLEWLCLFLVTLGYGDEGARMPRPRRYAGVLAVFAILGLLAEAGRGAARIASAAGSTFALSLLLNKVVAKRLIGSPEERKGGKVGGFLGGLTSLFGLEADPPHDGAGRPQDTAAAAPPSFYWPLPTD